MPSRRGFLVGASAGLLPAASQAAAAPVASGTGPVSFPRTQREMAASVLPVSPAFPEADIRRYGADMTGQRPSDEAWANWLRVLYAGANRTNPTGQTQGWGLGVAHLPKGKIRLLRGYVAPASAIGLIIRGQGQHATVIEFHNDHDPFFSQTSYVNLIFEDLEINHVPQNPDPSSWRNVCFQLNGAGGGRKFQLNRVRTYRFATVIRSVADINEDTFHVEHSEFYDFARDFLFTRNSQSVVNSFVNCTWAGGGESVFNYSGFGHTTVLNGNIIFDGVWLKPFGQAAKWGPTAVMLFINTKGEPRNYSRYPAGSRSGIVRPHGDWAQFRHQIRLLGCGFMSSNYPLDPRYKQIELNSGIDFLWDGGSFLNRSAIRTYSANIPDRHRSVQFRNLQECPPPTNLERNDSAPGGHPSVSFVQCSQGHAAGRIPNLTIGHRDGSKAPVTLTEPVQTNQLGGQSAASQPILISGPGSSELELDFFGSVQEIEEISVSLAAKRGGSLQVNVYLDAARSQLVDTIRFTSPDNGDFPPSRKASAAVGRITDQGVYVTITADQPHHGYIHASHRAR